MDNQQIQPQCLEAESYYIDYFQDNKASIPDSISAHIDGCPDCQAEMQWLKDALAKSEEDCPPDTQATLHAAQMKLHCDLIDQPVRCSIIKSFLPILANPEMSVRISTPVTVHIEACPKCSSDLETLKQLNLSPEQLSTLSLILTQKHSEKTENIESITDTYFRNTKNSSKAIRRIMDRPDSGIITTFRTEDSSVTSEESYHVEVIQGDALDPSPQSSPDRQLTETHAVAHTQWFFKPVAAAAAILIIAILLFQNTSVKATDIGQIYEALKSVNSVTMTQYETNNPIPVQTTWICRSLGIKLFETEGGYILYDINNKTQKTRTGPDSEIQQTDLSRNTIQSVANEMEVPWGLLPFSKTSELSTNAVWKKVQAEGIDLTDKPIEIYDLFWSEKSMGGKSISYQWRCHLDPETKHPFKVEWWTQEPGQPEYELVSLIRITYPTQDKILQIIDQAGL